MISYLRRQGSIYHLVYSNEKGEKKSFSLKTTEEKKANILLAQFKAQQTVDLPFEIFSQKPKILFSEAVKLFLTSRHTEDSTKENYNFAALSWRIHCEDRYIQYYTEADYTTYVKELQAEGKSAFTIKSYSSQLYIIFTWLIAGKYIKDNPIVKPKRSKIAHVVKPMPFYQVNVIVRDLFLRGMFKQFDLVMVTYLCALRISEALLMEYSDIDLEEKIIWVRNKKGKRIDTIPILEDMESYLTQLVGLGLTGRMFDYAHRQSVTSFWRFVNKKYKFKNTFHSLRKARGSDLASSGLDPLDLREFMRHTDIRTTLTYYILMDLDKMRKRINKKITDD